MTQYQMNKCLKNKKPKVIAIVGPTASGKTDYAINYAINNNGEIISADSRLVYKGFNISCAKPSINERHGIPHYMIDIAEPEFDYSAGLYAKDAKKIIYEITEKGKLPIVVGGTGLYFRLLLENYNMPAAKPNLEKRNLLQKCSSEELFDLLNNLDSEGASTIDKNDKKKLIRAVEIVQTTGKPLNEARGINTEGEFDVEWIGLNYPRAELYKRINKRVDLMLEKGMIEETKSLLEKHGRIQNLISTIGYQEMIMYLDGVLTLDEAVEKLKQNTRRYAKRQLTWFRRNENIKWNHYPETLQK